MIKIDQISRGEFKTELLQNKESILWFIWHAHNKVDGIYFNSLFKNKIHIGVCFCIINKYSIEIGILIKKEYRNNGFGSELINQLMRNREKTLKFKVSINNIDSLNFFQKFVNLGKLNIRKEEDFMVFTTIK